MTRPLRRGLFSRIELATGLAVPAAEAATATAERLRDIVVSLRGDRR